MRTYIVYDTRKQKFWSSRRGRVTWAGPKLARNSWEQDTGRKFDKQLRYQVHEAFVVRGLVVPQREL